MKEILKIFADFRMTQLSRQLLLLLTLSFLTCCSQAPDDPVTHFSGIKMTIPYHIMIGSRLDHRKKVQAQKIIDDTFEEINRIFNKWNPHSEISSINNAEANFEHTLSPSLRQFLLQVDALVTETDGRFDPTVESAQQLWKTALARGERPTQSQIDRILPSLGWHRIHITQTGLWKENKNTTLDLGGIAKGYAIDLIALRLKESGFHNLYVEWGGDIAVKGRHPENRPWRVLVTKWGVPGDTRSVVELNDMAIASSGDYLQNWIIEEEAFTHIFNPITGSPLKITPHSICSVTVTASNCLVADAIATTAMLFETKTDAENWLESIKADHPELQYWVFTR